MSKLTQITKMKKEYKLKCYEGYSPRIKVTKDFVKRNNLRLVRTQKEIIERINNDDIFGFAEDVLLDYLSWKNAKKFYKKEYVKKVEDGKEEKPRRITDIYETAQDFLDYMVFGWMKAVDQRGLSAGRTICKLAHWLWLMGRDDLKALIQDDDLYNPYGAPALIAVCKKMGIKVPKYLTEFAKHKE